MTILGRRESHFPPMGALPAKIRKKSKHNWSWKGPAGEHSPYPTDPAPYPGYQITYCFLDIMAAYKALDNTVNLGPMAVSTDVDNYMQDLEACYAEGYHLNAYIRVPGIKNSVAVEDWSVKTPYQAILSKPLKVVDHAVTWKLCVERCILSTRMRAFDCLEGENDLLSIIRKHSEAGARLRCAVPVGYVRSSTTPNTQYGVMGMELFFNIPTTKTATTFTYHAIKIPARYYTALDATQTIQQVNCDSDFLGQMKLFLNQGWKLVDICIDTMALAEAFRMKTSMKIVDTVWIFEKDKSKLGDTTPQYEGVIIEYLHKVKTHPDGDYPCKDWRPVIAGMGVMGWQLAAMIQSPVIVQSGFTTYTMKMLMIFQRKLVASFEKLRNMKSTKVMDFPAFSTKRSPTSKGNVYHARGCDEENTGYYHQTLKKFIYSNDSSINGPVRLSTYSTEDAPSQSGELPPQIPQSNFFNVNGFIPQGSGMGSRMDSRRNPFRMEGLNSDFSGQFEMDNVASTYNEQSAVGQRRTVDVGVGTMTHQPTGQFPPTYTEAMRLNVPIT